MDERPLDLVDYERTGRNLKDTHMQLSEKKPEEDSVTSYDLLYITRAYNRKEINFDDWLRLSREWAERVIRAYGTDTS